MARCRKGVFGKYCVLIKHGIDESTYCGSYRVCNSDNKVTEDQILAYQMGYNVGTI